MGKATIHHVGRCEHVGRGRWHAVGWLMEGGPGVEFDEQGRMVRLGGYTFAELAELAEQRASQRRADVPPERAAA